MRITKKELKLMTNTNKRVQDLTTYFIENCKKEALKGKKYYTMELVFEDKDVVAKVAKELKNETDLDVSLSDYDLAITAKWED